MSRIVYWTSFGLVFVAAVLLSGCGGGGSGGSSTPPPRVAFLSDRTGNLDIYIATMVTGFPTVNLTNDPAGDDAFCWSPTGNQLAFLSDRSGSWELWVINANGSGATQLTANGGTKADPAWSPAGNKIAFVYNSDICVYDLTTNTSQNLTMGNGNNRMPCWSLFGNKIVFASDRSGNWDIWMMDANGANPTQLTSDPQDEQRPVWSPNNLKIAFERGNHVWVMDANGANPVNISSGAGTLNRWPTWSANSQIVFFEGDGDIYRNDPTGTTLVKITHTGNNYTPNCPKSGSGVVFLSSNSGNPEIYFMTIWGSSVQNISNDPAVDELPICAP